MAFAVIEILALGMTPIRDYFPDQLCSVTPRRKTFIQPPMTHIKSRVILSGTLHEWYEYGSRVDRTSVEAAMSVSEIHLPIEFVSKFNDDRGLITHSILPALSDAFYHADGLLIAVIVEGSTRVYRIIEGVPFLMEMLETDYDPEKFIILSTNDAYLDGMLTAAEDWVHDNFLIDFDSLYRLRNFINEFSVCGIRFFEENPATPSDRHEIERLLDQAAEKYGKRCRDLHAYILSISNMKDRRYLSIPMPNPSTKGMPQPPPPQYTDTDLVDRMRKLFEKKKETHLPTTERLPSLKELRTRIMNIHSSLIASRTTYETASVRMSSTVIHSNPDERADWEQAFHGMMKKMDAVSIEIKPWMKLVRDISAEIYTMDPTDHCPIHGSN